MLWIFNMKRISAILLSAAFIFTMSLNSFAQKQAAEDILIVLPAQGIAGFLTRLFPYEVNMGKNFSGSISIKSIKNLKIEENRISFSSHIHGKDVIYTPNAGKTASGIELGNIDLFNEWESAVRFDAGKKTLFIKPHLKKQAGTEKAGQKEIIINTLFKVLSDIEYPINLQEITPVTAEILGNSLTINFDILSISAADNKLTVKLRPIPQKGDKNKTPVEKKG
jgi:hypothetical protein